MTQTVDTNVLLYASNAGAAEHERARRLVDHLAAGPSVVVLLWPTILGYLRIATHASIFPSPLSPEAAARNIDALLGAPAVRVVGESDGFWREFQTVADPVRPRGNLVPDAHLAALMRQHGVSTIWTRDRDFRKFDGIRVKDPFDERYATAFDV
jgi:toxin-antitoxin system PIN domain toxin